MTSSPFSEIECTVFELRDYTLHHDTRETLIELFDQEFIETQEAVGMSVLGQFRDLNRPDHFIWIRGFPDMAARKRALTDFYEGPVWMRHRDVANGTMIDFSNVLLLRVAAGRAFVLDPVARAPSHARGNGPGLFAATTYSLQPGHAQEFCALFERDMIPILVDAGIEVAAAFVTDDSPNTFTRLPVREGEQVFVWFARSSDLTAYQARVDALTRDTRWQSLTRGPVAMHLLGEPEVRLLAPTARSRIHW